jgi:hypothetical protein
LFDYESNKKYYLKNIKGWIDIYQYARGQWVRQLHSKPAMNPCVGLFEGCEDPAFPTRSFKGLETGIEKYNIFTGA